MGKKLAFFIFIISLGIVVSKNQFDQNLKVDSKNIAATIQVSGAMDNDENNLEYDIVETRPHLSKYFKSISELNQDSDIIIEGVVKNTKNVIYVQQAFTISEIDINEVYKSESKVVRGSTICVVEPGGIMDKEFLYKKYKEKFPEKYIDINEIEPVKDTFDGIPALEKGDYIIIFASKYTGGVKSEDFYEPVGLYQGKFYINEDKVEHKMPIWLKNKFKDKVKTKEELINLIKKDI